MFDFNMLLDEVEIKGELEYNYPIIVEYYIFYCIPTKYKGNYVIYSEQSGNSTCKDISVEYKVYNEDDEDITSILDVKTLEQIEKEVLKHAEKQI